MRQMTVFDDSAPIPVEKWRKMQKQKRSEQLHDRFMFDCRTHGLPTPIREHQFAKATLGRRWEFDFCFPEYMVAAEIEGLVVKRVWVAEFEGVAKQPLRANGRVVNVKDVKSELVSSGRHAHPEGFIEDCVKYNSAALLGWTVLRFHQKQIESKDAIEMTVRVMSAKGWKQ